MKILKVNHINDNLNVLDLYWSAIQRLLPTKMFEPLLDEGTENLDVCEIHSESNSK